MKKRFFLYAMSAAFTAITPALQAEEPVAKSPAKTETAVLGGGCFWCVEAQYLMLKGVLKVTSGYAGGHVENPTYEQVCEKTTGHAEVIQIQFNPNEISYRELVDLFWVAHDPTTLNQQGADHGPQYRSTLMYVDEAQKKAAEASLAEAQKVFDGRIVTELVALKTFYPAEKEHQNYFNLNPSNGYCSYVISPKVVKFRAKLEAKKKLKTAP
jgi:peptide-methionine (S)-S-oxide reductase